MEPVDPAVAEVLATLQPDPGAWDDIAGSRAAFRLLVQHAPRDPRIDVEELAVPGGDGQSLTVRVYRPQQPSGVVGVWFHGGGFVFGDLDSEDVACQRVCARLGAVVVSVDYRLAPEHPFPAGVEDCYAALVWAGSTGAERLFVGGHSAGGGLAAAVALLARDRGGPALAFQYLGYPALDDRPTASSLSVVDPRVLDAHACRRMWAYYLGGQEGSPYAAPARADDLSGLPPAYVLVVEHDPLRDEGLDYASRLATAGVPVTSHLVRGAFHGFEGLVPESALALDTVERSLVALAEGLGVPLLPR